MNTDKKRVARYIAATPNLFEVWASIWGRGLNSWRTPRFLPMEQSSGKSLSPQCSLAAAPGVSELIQRRRDR